MAQPGLTIGNPHGERVVFRKTTAETAGELLEVEAVYAPQSPRPPAHFHPHQEERFIVLKGAVSTCIDGVEREYREGEAFVIPIGINHWMHNAGAAEARVRWEIRPALNTERFFESVFGLTQDGILEPGARPNLLRMAPILFAHRREFRLSQPPAWVQTVLFSVLSPLSALAGYSSVYNSKASPASK